MDYVVRVYYGTQLFEKGINPSIPFTVGGHSKDMICLSGSSLPAKCFSLNLKKQGWSICSKQKAYQSVLGVANELHPFRQLLLVDQNRKIALSVYESSPDFGHQISLSGKDTFLIGRSEEADITISEKRISSKHIRLIKNGEQWTFEDLNSSNGTYKNGVQTAKSTLTPEDILFIGSARLQLEQDWISIFTQDRVVSHLETKKQRKGIQNPDDPYPYEFRQSPRLREELSVTSFDLEPPPAIGGKPAISWFNVLLMPILTVLVMFAVSFFTSGAFSMLLFSVPMTLVGVFMSILNYRRQQKQYRQSQALRLEKYEQYLKEKESAIQHCIQEQCRILNTSSPSCRQCCTIAAGPERTLWDRRAIDSDFMSLRIGSGSVPAYVHIRAPHEAISLEQDTLKERPSEIAERNQQADNCPVTIDLSHYGTCGVIGPHALTCQLGKNLIVQAATHHSYEDLRIVLLCAAREAQEWSFCKWLPHHFDDTRMHRYYADQPKAAGLLLDSILEECSQRAEESTAAHDRSVPPKTPFYLFICADLSLIAGHPIMKLFAQGYSSLGIGAVFFAQQLSQLPTDSHYIVDGTAAPYVVYERENASKKQIFSPDSLTENRYEAFARMLAPLRINSEKKEAALPTGISFLQGFQALRPQELPILQNWSHPLPEQSMSVPIGVSPSGEPFFFDIHEKACGPHGLVAGMTGSGKSEMVQSWILSMAIHFPPQAVSFILIDFKGTGLLQPFKNLPHLAGSISDLDTSIGRNLLALENELNRRKELLDANGVSNISAYLNLLHQGKVSQTLPYLFVVIDEFAEFRLRFPDFMEVVNRIFAIGRTLGVHIILLTQKPASVVDDKMMANTRFRWCLKVASSEDSRDMLHHADAAKITNPGRAYVQVGEDEVYALIQSYWSGAPYNPYRSLSIQRSNRVSVVDAYGNRLCYEPEKTTGYRSEKSEIDAVVTYLDTLCREQNIDRAHAIWTAQLPQEVYLKDMMQIAFDGERWSSADGSFRAAVGLLDDPRSQSQYPLYFEPDKNGHIAIYGAPGTGKTTLLHTTILSFALSYSPEDLHMYLMDFAGGSLNLFRQLPHVGGVAIRGEEERIQKIQSLLSEELQQRKNLLLEEGLVNYRSYKEATGRSMPAILLLIDHFMPIPDQYPDLADFLHILVQEGGNYGIHLIVAAGGINSISYRISQNIKTCVALQMTDTADYAALVGKTGGLLPAELPGRGLIKGNPPLEFQAALAVAGQTESERVASLRRLILLMREKWKGDSVQGIPVLPKTIHSADYPCTDIFLGLTSNTASPCTWQMTKTPFLAISSAEPKTHRAEQILAQLQNKVSVAQTICYRNEQDATGFDEALAAWMPKLQARKEAKESGSLSPEEPWLLIFIADHGSCFVHCENDTVRRLCNVVVLGEGLHVLLVSAGVAEDWAKLFHGGDPFTMQMTERAAALLLDGKIQQHDFFVPELSYQAKQETLTEKEALFHTDGKSIRIQTADT